MADLSPVSPALGSQALRAGGWRSYAALAKLRLNAMVLLTTLVGYMLACGGVVEPLMLLNTLCGVWLAASGASALNQYLERDVDARMNRTRGRPLPAAQIGEGAALQMGALFISAGVLQLALLVNLLPAFLCVLTAVAYLFVYTPLKRITPASTLAGAVPGALPPVIGWSAAQGDVSVGSWVLFAIMFCWQLPHFFAIAWMYRDDYRQAGLPVLSALDPDGRYTARHLTICNINMLFVSLLPCVVSSMNRPLAGSAYFAVAVVLGLGFTSLALRFWSRPSTARARAVLLGSLVYLPCLLVSWLLDTL
jgi:protoheme IX farnesyltransferase